MHKPMKVRCDGAKHCVNEVDLDHALRRTVVLRGRSTNEYHIPERTVLPCRFCTEGKVILKRSDVEEHLRSR